MKKQLSVLTKLLSIIPIIGLIILILYAFQISGQFPVEGQAVTYWKYRQELDYSRLLCIGIIPFGIFISVLEIIVWRKQWVTVVFVILPIIFSCVIIQIIAPVVLLTALGKYRHHDTYIGEEHIYHLASEWKVGVGSASRAVYLLWECNEFDSSCTIIDSEYIPPIYPEEEYLNTNAYIAIDDATNEVYMVILREHSD